MLSGGTIDWHVTASAAVPIRVDGTGQVRIGERVNLGYVPAPRLGSGEILLQARGKDSYISIGRHTVTSNNIAVVAMISIEIGENCQIGDLVTIYDSDFHAVNPASRKKSTGEVAPVTIGNNVWLGSRVMVLKGVTIGDNTVVAAGSIVTKSLPPNVVAAGIPAKVVREI